LTPHQPPSFAAETAGLSPWRIRPAAARRLAGAITDLSPAGRSAGLVSDAEEGAIVSMPGFRYGFFCSACGEGSEDYPAFVFPNLFDPQIILPSWSRELRCYGEVILCLTQEQRQRLEQDHEARVALAASLSSPAMTVGSPRLFSNADGSNLAVDVTPAPICPLCGGPVEVWFGDPPR
jgi:hypothetical protein